MSSTEVGGHGLTELETAPDGFVFRLGEPREPVVRIPIEVPYAPQTIIATSKPLRTSARLRRQDRYIKSLFTGVTEALEDQGVDPEVTANSLSELSNGTTTLRNARTSLDKLLSIGIVERGRDGYRSTFPTATLRGFLSEGKDFTVPAPRPNLWERKGLVSRFHRDLISSVLRYIDSNKIFIPSVNLKDLDDSVCISERQIRNILWSISSSTHPLLNRLVINNASGYTIADHNLAARILEGLEKEYSITPILLDREARPPQIPESKTPEIITPFSGTIQFKLIDGRQISLTPSRIRRLLYLGVLSDKKMRNFIAPNVTLSELSGEDSEFSREQMYEAMSLAKRIGLVSEDAHLGYRLSIPIEDFYSMFIKDTDTVIPYPDETIYIDSGFPDDRLRAIDAIAEYINRYGQFVIRDHGSAVARSLGITLHTLRSKLDLKLIRGQNPLLKRIDQGVYVVASGQKERLEEIVAAYNTPHEFVIAPVEPSTKVKRVEFAPPPAELVIDRVHQAFIAHVSSSEARRKLSKRERFAELFYSLVPAQQEVLWHRLGERLTSAQIGRLMGTTEGGAKAEQHRAIARIGQLLGVNFYLDRLDDFRKPRPKKHVKRNRRQYIDEFKGENRDTLEVLRQEVINTDDRYLAPFATANPNKFKCSIIDLSLHQQQYLYERFILGKTEQELGAFFGWDNASAAVFMLHYRIFNRLHSLHGAEKSDRRRRRSTVQKKVVVFDSSTPQP